jgi:hypothetical protein
MRLVFSSVNGCDILIGFAKVVLEILSSFAPFSATFQNRKGKLSFYGMIACSCLHGTLLWIVDGHSLTMMS